MSFQLPSQATPVVLSFMTTLTTGTDRCIVPVPCDMELFQAFMSLGTTGSGGGNTDIVVNYTAPTGGVTTSGALWTVGNGVGRIAGGSTTPYLNWTRTNFSLTHVEAGGTLSLAISAIPGTASTNLLVVLYGYPYNR